MQPLLHQLQVPARRLASSLRFLLESVKDVYRSRIPQAVNGAKRIAAKVLYHFHHPCPAKAAERVRIAMLAAALRDVEGITHVILDRSGKRTQVPAARPKSPASRTDPRSLRTTPNIVISLYPVKGDAS